MCIHFLHYVREKMQVFLKIKEATMCFDTTLTLEIIKEKKGGANFFSSIFIRKYFALIKCVLYS